MPTPRRGFTLVELPAVSKRAFTLVELLVVIAIIVILLALLVGGLEKALKAAERSRCGTQQRSLAQGCAMYALEQERTFPVATTIAAAPALAPSSLQIREAAVNSEAGRKDPIEAQGLGHLVVSARVGGMSGAGGEALHCPSLDTTSGSVANVGMNNANTTAFPNTGAASTGVALNNAVGCSYWSSANILVTSGYNYRAMSYYRTHSNGAIRTNIAKATFAITSDLVTYAGSGAERYGREYHHLTGWNVSFGDGHCEYVLDPEGSFVGGASAATVVKGYVEREVAKGVAIRAVDNTTSLTDEQVYKWFGTKSTQ